MKADATMNDKNSTEAKAALDQNVEMDVQAGSDSKAPSDFVTGLVTFIIFLFFMTAWMYFSTE